MQKIRIDKDAVVFIGKRIIDSEEVSGFYFENRGQGYITEMDEEVQPPIKRMHEVDPGSVYGEVTCTEK